MTPLPPHTHSSVTRADVELVVAAVLTGLAVLLAAFVVPLITA